MVERGGTLPPILGIGRAISILTTAVSDLGPVLMYIWQAVGDLSLLIRWFSWGEGHCILSQGSSMLSKDNG
jgi:hypothetical protein